ncbi:MAG: MerR family DNA-binding transcriptional regulator [Ignavibacteria bacterium]|nr:MerR family DNA-binding transcriptional regulator [Ignavibacteria bacterium]
MSRDLSTTLLQSKASDSLYTIGEAADVLGVSVPTIRMYEREGLIIPYRKRSRHRRFSAGGLERIRCLLALIPCWSIRNCPEDERKN